MCPIFLGTNNSVSLLRWVYSKDIKMNERLQQHFTLAQLEAPMEWRDTAELQAVMLKLTNSIYNDCFLIASASLSTDDAGVLLSQLKENFGL